MQKFKSGEHLLWQAKQNLEKRKPRGDNILEDEFKTYLLKRINAMPKEVYRKATNNLKLYNIQEYDSNGSYALIDNLILEFNKTAQILSDNNKLDKDSIRRQLVDFISTVKTLVGLRKFSDFLRLVSTQ